MNKIVIIGAGPAGLAAASKLSERNVSSIILEKDSMVGGISRTVKYKGCYFDIGPHRFFTKNKAVFNWWQDNLKGNFIKKSRYTRIYYKGKMFNYPIAISNVILNLGLFGSFPIFLSYLKSCLFPARNEDCFQNWVINRFGNRLFQIFFRDYTEKLWGMPCSEISADWAAQRIKGLSLSSALGNCLQRGKKNKIKTLVSEFYYPRFGSGMMYETVARRIIEKGCTIKLNSEVVQIKHNNKKIMALICKDASSGKLFEIEGTDFCSSMPLNLLVSRMDPLPGEGLLKVCRQLNYRSLLMVYFILGRQDLFKDNWIYIHSKDIKAGRIQNYKNWGMDMVSSPAVSSLGLEYFCTEGDLIWAQSDAAAIKLAVGELERLKIAGSKDILAAFVLRVPNAYPVYGRNYREAIEMIKGFISRFTNLQCMGRAGMFRYNNMDHSILTGFLAADNILGQKTDLWNINIEHSYHEEIEED